MINKSETNILKGIAILLVILSHITVLIGNLNENIRNILGTSGVCLFLILSGYGTYLSYSKKGLDINFWNK